MKRLLLVGGGHSHLAVLKALGDAPAPGDITLLSPHRYVVYSGMIPGLIAGHYHLEHCRVDLQGLASRAGARMFEDSAIRVDAARREVITAAGERLAYDLLSLDVGSAPGEPPAVAQQALRVRPVEAFLSGWHRLRESIARQEVRRVALVGGGAAGVEIVLAMQHATAGAAVEFALFSETRILAGHNRNAQRRLERILASHRVAVRARKKVVAVLDGGIELERGERVEAQATIWATGAGAPSWIAASGLATDPGGFIAVGDTLQSISHPEIFAAGDCATLIGGRGVKSGVIAVRQGPVLARNLVRALAGAAPESFHEPQRTLALISCGDRYAVASWDRFAVEGAWVWRWKDRIDRRFVERYRT
jgi:selenide,water dikinase